MRVARLRKAEFATPIVALHCDGAYYDVAELESRWFRRRAPLGGDFFERVVARRAAGLRELYDRLLLGDRPTEARLLEGEYLPLPPTAVERCAFFGFGPAADSPTTPQITIGNSRNLVGDGSPAVFGGAGSASCGVGLAVVLGEDLVCATPDEARRAVLGFGLLADWCWGQRGGEPAPSGLGPPTHFGPDLAIVERDAPLVRKVALAIQIGERQSEMESKVCAFETSEALSYLSQRCSLRAGDLIGLGAMTQLEEIGFGERVEVRCTVAGIRSRPHLQAWAAAGAPPQNWRRDVQPES